MALKTTSRHLPARGVSLAGMVALLVVAAMVAGCDRAEGQSGDAERRPRIVATTTVIGDLVRQIAGDLVELKVLMGPGVDPHTYKPSTSDVGALARADRIFYNGLHLEGKMVTVFEQRLPDRAVAVTRDIPQDRLLSWQAGGSGAHDPHVWFDVRLWQQAARTVGEELERLDGAHAEQYRQRLDVLLARMDELDAHVRQQAARVPPERRIVVTSHDAFSYFGAAYGFEVRGLQGISTETEVGLANIRDAVQFILQRKLSAIFVESSVSPKTIERVQADCATYGMKVTIGGELYSDAMGTPGERPGYAVETYDGMIRYNIDSIVQALGAGLHAWSDEGPGGRGSVRAGRSWADGAAARAEPRPPRSIVCHNRDPLLLAAFPAQPALPSGSN